MIEIFLDGRNFGKNGTKFSIVLSGSGMDGKGKHIWERSFDAEKVTANQSVMHALLFALKSIKPRLRGKSDVKIYIDNKFVLSMMERDGDEWKRNPSSNVEIVRMIRRAVGEFMPRIEFTSNPESENSIRVKKLTEMAAFEGKYTDSHR